MAMATSIEHINGIYLGDRGDKFKTLVISVLKRGIRNRKHLSILTDEKSMDIYSAVFTSELIDEEHNYQVYEQLGDLSANKFIVWYFYRRFPQLKCTEGVKVAARLRINYGAKKSFYKIAQDLGFWEFISATKDLRLRKMKPLLEDVFEAFMGATEWILDNRLAEVNGYEEPMVGIGYSAVHKIMKNIFDDMDISLKYEDLYDAKTRLKELGDKFRDEMGSIIYREEKKDTITYSKVFRVVEGGQHIEIGQGSAALKADAQQNASQVALDTLNQMGFVKEPPRIYRMFQNGEIKTSPNVEHLNPTTINELIPAKRTKYQSKYESTRVARFCKIRNYSGVKACVKLGADVNIVDTDGMSPLDLVFIGRIDDGGEVKKILKKLVKGGCNLEMSRVVYDTYYVKYIGLDVYFSNLVGRITVVEDEE